MVTTGPMLHNLWARTIARKIKVVQSRPGIFRSHFVTLATTCNFPHIIYNRSTRSQLIFVR